MHPPSSLLSLPTPPSLPPSLTHSLVRPRPTVSGGTQGPHRQLRHIDWNVLDPTRPDWGQVCLAPHQGQQYLATLPRTLPAPLLSPLPQVAT